MFWIVQVLCIAVAAGVLVSMAIEYRRKFKEQQLKDSVCAKCKYCKNISSMSGINCTKRTSYIHEPPIVCNESAPKTLL